MPVPRIAISKAKTAIATNPIASLTSSITDIKIADIKIAYIADIQLPIFQIADIKIAGNEIFSPHTLVHPQLQQLQLR